MYQPLTTLEICQIQTTIITTTNSWFWHSCSFQILSHSRDLVLLCLPPLSKVLARRRRLSVTFDHIPSSSIELELEPRAIPSSHRQLALQSFG